ncbi:hypothetical protein [Deinococcus hopiensis]|uniref:Outer membrane protein beta-barrel domain-containing protein n=1 Tax=Deinococcus hopiensis KR-140 TaxID=695939 RepID=A0A1W1VKC7_9DEIO|nr:hypothetical protein [Deinococcus hopiensis]SMB93817.1 hypothetical protein SAMN00790413_02126 [Deinococcus hopiensis KR-140]
MKKLLAMTISAAFATAGAQTLTSTGLNGVELGLTAGYANGLSGEAFVHAPNVVGPFGIKAGVSFTRAADAINDNSPLLPGISNPNDPNQTFGAAKSRGEVTESGSHTIASLDGTYGFGELTPGVDATVYAGARYGMFRSVENYGSNGTLGYSSSSFGVGGGLMVSYALTGNLSLVGDLGVDQFFNSTINTTTTAPDGSASSDSFATNEAGYADISNRFVRPGTVFKARIGVKTTF